MARQNQGPLSDKAAKTDVVDPALFDESIVDTSGAGIGTSPDDYAIPFLTVLQSNSPQVDEASGQAIEGARAGMLFENITGRLFARDVGAAIVPVAYRRVFVRWGPRGGDGAGFKGELTVDAATLMRERGEVVELDNKLLFPLPDGSVHEKRSDRLVDTRNWYVFLIDAATGAWVPALMSLTSTQIKKSKQLASMIDNVRVRTPAGALVRPWPWYNVVRVTTAAESNDKGSWYGVQFKMEGNTAGNAALHQDARKFAESVRQNAVAAKYEEPQQDGGHAQGF